MESLTTQAVSLAIIIGLNLLVCILLWSEYAGHRIRFLKYVSLAQTFILAWHVLSALLVFYPQPAFLQTLSLATFFLVSGYFLVASAYRQLPAEKRVHGTLAALAGIVALAGLVSAALRDALWIGNAIALLAVPVVTLLYFRQVSWRLITFFQFLVFAMFMASAVFFRLEYALAGGFFYLLLGLFQPILSIIFLVSSIRIDRRAIENRERDYRIFFETVNEVFFRLSPEGVIQEVSPSIRQFGYAPETITGRNLGDFLVDADAFLAKLNPLVPGLRQIDYKGGFLSPEGRIDCDIICSKINDHDHHRHYIAGAIRNTQERNQLEHQFIEAQRQENLGLLAGNMAHDFNNLLQGIMGHAEMLLEIPDIDDTTKSKGLNAILNSAAVAGDLCKQLMQYTGKGVRSRDTFNLAATVAETVDMLRPYCPDGVSLQLELPGDTVPMEGDRNQISQVVINLVRNALESVGDAGTIHVSLDRAYIDKSQLAKAGLPFSLNAGSYHILEVKDDGAGIARNIQGRIFDPFFSTRKQGRGLGLSAVAGILKMHQGGIYLQSEENRGACFKVFLPALATMDQVTGTGQEKRPSQDIFILLVEDDAQVRDIASGKLQRAGYNVLQAEDGIEALKVFGMSRNPIDLVVTDIKMPNMDGIELAQKLTAQLPELPIVLISGYADVTDAMHRAQSLTFQFVSKPFRGNELLAAVEKASEQISLRGKKRPDLDQHWQSTPDK